MLYCHPYLIHGLFQLQSRRATPKRVNKGKRVLRLISYFLRETWNLMTCDWLVQQTEKYCSTRRMEHPEFQSGIFGRMESALGLPRIPELAPGSVF